MYAMITLEVGMPINIIVVAHFHNDYLDSILKKDGLVCDPGKISNGDAK